MCALLLGLLLLRFQLFSDSIPDARGILFLKIPSSRIRRQAHGCAAQVFGCVAKRIQGMEANPRLATQWSKTAFRCMSTHAAGSRTKREHKGERRWNG